MIGAEPSDNQSNRICCCRRHLELINQLMFTEIIKLLTLYPLTFARVAVKNFHSHLPLGFHRSRLSWKGRAVRTDPAAPGSF